MNKRWVMTILFLICSVTFAVQGPNIGAVHRVPNQVAYPYYNINYNSTNNPNINPNINQKQKCDMKKNECDYYIIKN